MACHALYLSSHGKHPSFVASCKFICEWRGDSSVRCCAQLWGTEYSSSPPLLNPKGWASVVHPRTGKEVGLSGGCCRWLVEERDGRSGQKGLSAGQSPLLSPLTVDLASCTRPCWADSCAFLGPEGLTFQEGTGRGQSQ